MLEACQAEYERRGKPLQHTGWDIRQVRPWMLHHLKGLKEGEDCGAYSYLLPERKSAMEAAPLPSHLRGKTTKPEEDEDADVGEGEESEEEADPEAEVDDEDEGPPSDGWIVERNKRKWYLVHEGAGESVELGEPEKGSSWEISTRKGIDYVRQEGKEDEEEEALDIFNEIKAAEKEMTVGKNAKPPKMKGMTGTGLKRKDESSSLRSLPKRKAGRQLEAIKDFGESSSSSLSPEGTDHEEDMEGPQPLVYCFEQPGHQKKMFLIDPANKKELKLPTQKCTDWVVTHKTDSRGKVSVLSSPSGQEEDVEVSLALASSKVKAITDPSRLKVAEQALEEHSQRTTAKTDTEKSKHGSNKDTKADSESELRARLEVELRARLEADIQKAEEEVKQKQEKEAEARQKKKIEEEMRAKIEEEMRLKLAEKKAQEDEKKAKSDLEAKKKKEQEEADKKAKAEKEAEMRARLEEETRKKLEEEIREKIMKEQEAKQLKEHENAKREAGGATKSEEEKEDLKKEEKEDEAHEAKMAEIRKKMAEEAEEKKRKKAADEAAAKKMVQDAVLAKAQALENMKKLEEEGKDKKKDGDGKEKEGKDQKKEGDDKEKKAAPSTQVKKTEMKASLPRNPDLE